MDDSFFGFDTSLRLDGDISGDQIAEPPEEEYDALNDETFGSAINGDWEEVHENLVRLTVDVERCEQALDNGNHSNSTTVECKLDGKTENELDKLNKNVRSLRDDSDNIHLNINLSTMKLDDFIYSDNIEDGFNIQNVLDNNLKLDINVWSSQPVRKDETNQRSMLSEVNKVDGQKDLINSLRQNVITPFQNLSQRYCERPIERGQTPNPSKICTLEDIERNLILQHSLTNQQDQKQQQKSHQGESIEKISTFPNSTENVNDTSKTLPIMLQPQICQQQQRSEGLELPYVIKKERIGAQLHQKEQQQQQQQQLLQTQSKSLPGTGKVSLQLPTNPALHHTTENVIQPQQQYHPYSQMTHNSHTVPSRPPPGLPMFPPGMCARFTQLGHPPQIPPHPLLNQHSYLQRSLSNSHLPIALNNFAMHPNFNAIRAAAAATTTPNGNGNTGVHPVVLFANQQQQLGRPMGHLPISTNQWNLLNHQTAPLNSSGNVSGNMFNMRLMQEIQQNHPLLQNAQRPLHPTSINPTQIITPTVKQQLHQPRNTSFANNKKSHYTGRNDNLISNANGNLPSEDNDEYSNLMSTRDKHWLIGIQLSQLNTDTPYIDDYYYTVYKERKGMQNEDSQAHKDNQLNHPLIQPKGHAQLILVQLSNKNGTRNGQLWERCNSDNYYGGGKNSNTVQDLKIPSYVFSPMKFENSLGKLQYGSVTAPRKIIDADVMTGDIDINMTKKTLQSNTSSKQTESVLSTEINDKSSQMLSDETKCKNGSSTGNKILTSSSTTASNESNAVNIQRKSRYILLHIESLYRIILKLDDLNNPNAIATILAKKKKENERIAALEHLEAANKTMEERVADVANNSYLKSKFTYDIETKESLIEKLIAGLQHDKIVAMMNVRKGKVLIKRILPYVEESNVRWAIWIGVFSSLENVFKKDRDDTEGLLYALHSEFKKQIVSANFENIVKISSAIIINDKKVNGIFCTKFGISSLVCLILQAEHVFLENNNETLTYEHKENWRNFLDHVASALNHTIQNQTICAAIEVNSIQAIVDHFARFKDLKLDSLLALIIEAK